VVTCARASHAATGARSLCERDDEVIFVARREGNVLISPQHPEFTGIVSIEPELVLWGARLFAPH